MAEENSNTALSVFVTGATLAAGRATMRRLVKQGHEVYGTAAGIEEARLIRADGGLPVYLDLFRAGEIVSNLKMAQADVIVNVAPQIMNHMPPHNPDWEYYTRLLTAGTLALVEAARQVSTVKMIVHAGSACVYGDAHGEWVNETAAPALDNALLEAAAEAERAVLESGGAVVRAGYAYGPEDAATIALREKLVLGQGLALGDDHNYANWVHVDDLAQALALIVNQAPAAEVFNIVDDTPASIAAFVTDFAHSQGIDQPNRARPLPLIGQFMQDATQATLLQGNARASNGKAREQLGWQPVYGDHKAGFEQTSLAWRAAQRVG